MAVAKTQARGGVSGIVIWLFVFVALWLTSTVLLVLLYTDHEDLVKSNDQLQADLRKVVGPQEKSLPFYLEATSQNPALALAEKARAETAEAATGDPQSNAAQVKDALARMAGQIIEDGRVPESQALAQMSFQEVANTLYDAYTNQHRRLAEVQEQADGLSSRVEQLNDLTVSQQEQFNQEIAGLEQDLAELKTATEDYRQARDEEVEQLEQRLAEIDAQFRQQLAQEQSKAKQLEDEFAELQRRHAELQEQLGELKIKPPELITARQADGKVVTAKPGDEVVYINLGKEAGLVLGLRFAVYSRGDDIPADGMAKGQVEVVNIFENSAECRITRLHGRNPIMEGDIIANPIFDPERSLLFVSVGDFDVDVASLVREWGGRVTDEVTAEVDFLVLGAPPERPYVFGDMTAENQERFQAQKERFENYQNALEKAQAMSIPILIESVFLHFLGYAGAQ